MDLNTFMVAIFCLIGNRIEDRALRASGPLPKLSEAEVLNIEIVGEFLGLDTDEAIFRYFRRHYGEWFPALNEVHRTTFARQAAKLWKLKKHPGRNFSVSLLTIRPSPSATRCPCRLASVRPRLPLFSLKAEAAFGKDTLLRQTFYGFRVHMRIC